MGKFDFNLKSNNLDNQTNLEEDYIEKILDNDANGEKEKDIFSKIEVKEGKNLINF